MIIFLYGSDGYRLRENLNIIVSAYTKKYKDAISYYNFDLESGAEFGDISNAIKSVSFFDEARLVVLKNIFSKKRSLTDDVKTLIINYKLVGDKKTVLAFWEHKSELELKQIDKKLFDLLSFKDNLVRKIEPLTGSKLTNWVRSRFKLNGKDASLPAVRHLIDIVGNDSWALTNEVNKISNYSELAKIEEGVVDLLVWQKETNNIFALTDALGNKQKAKAFEAIYLLLNSGNDGHYVLSMIFSHFENLLSVNDALGSNKHFVSENFAKRYGVHPFVVKKSAGQAKNFDKDSLKVKLNQIADLDIGSKNGEINLEDSLYNFTLS